jgi:TolB-like protein/Tfp pilus assembly protein PilF
VAETAGAAPGANEVTPNANKAVFLSYASQDAEAARRICESLRSGGVEVWFDADGGLEHGDEWDAKIRKQIKECVLFIPIISASTQARHEGYFRIEWDLAAERARGIASGVAFILPVLIDDTREPEALVPDRFRAVQWTKLPGGVVTPEVKARYLKLWSHRIGALAAQSSPPATSHDPHEATPASQSRAFSTTRRLPLAAVLMLALGLVALAVWRPWQKGSLISGGPAPRVTPAISEANRLVAKAWEQMDKTEMARNELLLAEGYCRQAAALEEANPAVWAAWSAMNTWYYFHQFERVPARKEAARDYAQKALALDPKSHEARYAWAHFVVRMAMKTGEERPALPILRELLRERPDEPRALYALGFGLIGDPVNVDEGLAMLERLAEKHPWFAGRALNEVGWVALFYGRFGLAESAADRALKAEPYWNNLGLKATLALRLHGDVDLAQATIDRLPSTVLQENWGISLAVTVADWRGDHARAVAILETVSRDWLENFFYFGPTSLLSGMMRLKAKQVNAAEKDFRRALEVIGVRLEKSPNDIALLWFKAEALRLLGVRDEADKTYRQLREVWPNTFAQVTFEPPEQALEYVRQMLQRGYTIEDFPPGWWFTAASLRLDPVLENVRRAPGFQALLEAEEEREKKQRAQTIPAAVTKNSVMASGQPAVGEKSVAVLAFKNLSGDPTREFFSDGLSEAVTDVLGRVPGLKVVGSASAFSFKGQSVSIPEIARQLGVTHLVEGTVLQEGQTVRITAKLIKADGFQVWISDKLDRELKNIFALHDEVAGLIAKNLSLKLGASSAASTAAVNPQAFELYLQARQAWNRRTPEGFDLGESLLHRALALEPNFARAHAALADVWIGRLNITRRASEPEAQPSSDELKRSREKIAQALALDPDSAEAHASLGSLLFAVEGKIFEAESPLRRALALNPNYAPAHQWFSTVLLYLGQMDQALEHSRLATELDPLSPRILTNYGTALSHAGRPAEALIAFDRALTLQPNFYQALRWKGVALVELGRFTEAVALVRRLPSEDARTPAIQLFVFARSGLKVEGEAILAEPRSHANNSLELPLSLLALGRTDEAMVLLTPKAIHLRASYLWEPIFDQVRADPRWVKFIADAGLTEPHARAQAWRKAHPPEKPATKP